MEPIYFIINHELNKRNGISYVIRIREINSSCISAFDINMTASVWFYLVGAVERNRMCLVDYLGIYVEGTES